MTEKLADLAQQVLAAAKKAGAEAADTLVLQGTSVSIEVRKGALEHAERSEGIDLGLRVFCGAGQACVSISNDSPASVAAMATRAVAMARVAPEDPTCGLAEPSQLAASWDVDALELFAPGDPPEVEELQQMALTAEAAALGVDGVSQAQSAGSGFSDTEIFLAASNGFRGGYRRGSYSTSCVAISGTGTSMERDYCAESRIHLADLPGAHQIGQLAGERAVARTGATRPPTGSFPVLFDERISASLIGHLVGAINGAAIVRGASFLKHALGQQILPSNLSLHEDPHRRRVGASRPFDGEGLPTAKRDLVKHGILQGWTLDLATARKLDMQSTASASRGTGAPPVPSTGNLTLTQGSLSREQLIAQMGTGLIITSLIGSTINPNTGDYSRGASGFWVENGDVTGPVNQCTVAGNLVDMFMNITPANDAREHLSRVVPSLLVEGLTIAGA